MSKFKFELDKTGFPMIWIEAIEAYMHWLPVTKIQFEYFLCATPDSRFDAGWYDTILALNPRISPNEIRANNYWEAFLSGILPGEVQRYVRWLGNGVTIPTLKEWFEAYKFLKAKLPISIDDIISLTSEKSRIKTLLSRIDTASEKAFQDTGYERTLADQMLMRMGLMEWVECPEQRFRWGGMGETHPSFHGSLFTPDHGQPSIPKDPESDRIHSYGFRLIWRKI